MTVDSDNDEHQGKRSKKTSNDKEVVEFNPEFRFELVGDSYTDILHSSSEATQDIVSKISKVGMVSTGRKIRFCHLCMYRTRYPSRTLLRDTN